MHPGRWYAAALGDPTSRALHPDAAPINLYNWRDWPWEILARIAIAAARTTADLLPQTAHITGDDVEAALALLARLESWVDSGCSAPFTEEIRADFAAGNQRVTRQRARWLREAAFGARAAIWAAARAAGPQFQSRDRLDPDVPRAAALAILHATSARHYWDWAQPGVGERYERKRMWSRMAEADTARAIKLRDRIDACRARARRSALPDPSAAMSARAAILEARAAELAERAGAITVEAPEHTVELARTIERVRARVVPWLVGRESFQALISRR